jgi:FMN-dependent oxidoreductase (nitrilotriacetate monooxygenase family)
VARLFASLDHFTMGRAAWNVVTSLNDSEAQNFGVPEHLEHDDRYDVADDFMEATSELWDSWEDGAVVLDKQTGRFADSDKVHRVDHAGKWFQVRGPLTVPRPPQGHPVLVQAGQSERGREFAARWGELLFVIYPTPEACKAYRDDLQRRARLAGRDPDSVRVAPAVYVVVGETAEEAEQKLQQIEDLANLTDSLTLLSEVFNYDFSQHPVDEPLSDEILASMTGLRGFLDRVIELSGTSNPSVNDFITSSGRGTLREFPVFTGTPTQVADQMESWFHADACDGFVLAATHMPGAYEDFVNLVIPELQRRGLFRDDYVDGTLRDNLGFIRP